MIPVSSSSKRIFEISSNCSLENPRCPPASGPSVTIKSAVLPYFLSQVFKSSAAARLDDTIGAIFAFPASTSSGRSTGSPAPQITASAPARTASLTCSLYCCNATMTLTAIIPFPDASSFARTICFRILRRLHASSFPTKSGSSNPICAVEITPMPPSDATAPARPLKLTPTPMPPWISGRLRFHPSKRFIEKIFFIAFSSIIYSFYYYI